MKTEGLFISHIVKRTQKDCILKFRWGGADGPEIWAMYTEITLISPPYKDEKVVSRQITNIINVEKMENVEEIEESSEIWEWARKYLNERR